MNRFAYILLLLVLASCSKNSDTAATTAAATTTTYPTGFAIGSPLSSSSTTTASVQADYGILAFNKEANPDAKADALDAVAKGTTAAACTISLPTLTAPTSPSCYGPQLDFQNHIDGTGGTSPLPTGDLGIWTSTEGSANEACAAAKLNSLINTATAYIDSALLYSASIACLMRVNGTAAPAAGASVDVKSLLATATT